MQYHTSITTRSARGALNFFGFFLVESKNVVIVWDFFVIVSRFFHTIESNISIVKLVLWFKEKYI